MTIPLTVREGHRYRMRCGQKTAVLSRMTYDVSESYPWDDGSSIFWACNGKVWLGTDSDLDLIEDLGPAEAASPRFSLSAAEEAVERAWEAFKP